MHSRQPIPDPPEHQRDCGVVPLGSQVEILIKDGGACYSGLATRKRLLCLLGRRRAVRCGYAESSPYELHFACTAP
jgi:hypothetical protein